MIRTGASICQLRVVEAYKRFHLEKTAKGLFLASDMLNRPERAVEISWLPLAAEQYNISPSIEDYVICDVPIVAVGLPNRNLDEFPFEEVTRFDPEFGAPVYRSFVGKPTHKDHDNKDHRKAKGVIFDASLEKEASGLYVIRILAGFDRAKDSSLTAEILSGRRPGHSMGALVSFTQCSYPGCKATSTTGKLNCAHMEGSIGKGRVINGQLIYERCFGTRFIENSSVGDAANVFAQQRWAK